MVGICLDWLSSDEKNAFDRALRVVYNEASFRGVAQPGSALGLGPRGRRFESSRPDSFTAKGKWGRWRGQPCEPIRLFLYFLFCARSSGG